MIEVTFAPPDMWSRQKDSGRTMAEIFFECGVPIVRADNSRVQGHMMIKDLLAKRRDGRPSLMFFETCRQTLDDLRDIQADEQNPNDCAREPHEVTHRVDAVRYYAISRTVAAELHETRRRSAIAPDAGDGEAYDDFMTGRGVDDSYLGYA